VGRFLRRPGRILQSPPDPLDLILGEVGAVALALDAQALLECFEHIVITHAKLFC
jgi:hypothetical protein